MMPDASFDRVNGKAGVEVLFFLSDYHFPFDLHICSENKSKTLKQMFIFFLATLLLIAR